MKEDRKVNLRWEWRESRRVRGQDELRAGDQILATLCWQGAFSTLAFGTSPAGQWTFERPRVLSQDVEVCSAGADVVIAIFKPHWAGGGGRLELADGRTFQWTATNFWQTDWVFSDASGESLVRFEDNSRLFETTALVEVECAALPASERALLTLLGRYLMVLQERDAAAMVAAFTPAIVG